MLVATVAGVDRRLVARVLESCGRCRRGRPRAEYRTGWDLYEMRAGIPAPVVFDVISDSRKHWHRQIAATPLVVVPCRPDLIWAGLCDEFADPASAFCNRMRRLRELARLPRTLVVPYEVLGTAAGLAAVQAFVGAGRPLSPCGWEEPGPAPDCPMVRRYERDVGRLAPLPGWYAKWV